MVASKGPGMIGREDRCRGRWWGAVLLTAVAGCSPVSDLPPGPAPALSPEAVRGRVVFLERADPPCGVCHALREAGATATLGPDLDELAPSPERVARISRRGIGIMDPQPHLSERELEDLGTYVAEAVALRSGE